MEIDLELLAEGTTLHIVFYKSTNARPPRMGTQSIVRFKFAWTASGWGVVLTCYNLAPDRKILRNITFVTIEKDRFIINMINCPVR